MILTPQIGQMKRVKSHRDAVLMKVLCRGRGINDPMVSRMPDKLRGQLKAALEDAAIQLKQPINNLVWRMDRSGIVHVQDRDLGEINV